MAREDFEELLFALGLQAYITSLKEEALDLEALSLAAAIDLRSVLKMPLGSALKLVNAARATEVASEVVGRRPSSEQKCRCLGLTLPGMPHNDCDDTARKKVTLPPYMEEQRSPSIVTQNDDCDGKDSLDQPVPPGQAMEEPKSLHASTPRGSDKAKKVIDNTIMRRDVLRYDSAAGDPPPVANYDAPDKSHPRMRPHRWPLIYSWRHIVCLLGWYDPFMPADHAATFKYNLYFSKGGEELKGHLLALSDMWVVGLSLIVGTMSELWGVFPEEGIPKQLMAFHNIMVGSNLMASICAVVVFGVTYINVSAVHVSNIHSYMVGAMGALQIGESLLVTSLYLTMAIIGLTGYSRLYILDLDHWIWYVVLTVMYSIIVPAAAAAVHVLSRLTLETGYMRAVKPAPGPGTKGVQLTNSTQSPEAVLDNAFREAWGRTYQVRSRFKVLERHWFVK